MRDELHGDIRCKKTSVVDFIGPAELWRKDNLVLITQPIGVLRKNPLRLKRHYGEKEEDEESGGSFQVFKSSKPGTAQVVVGNTRFYPDFKCSKLNV